MTTRKTIDSPLRDWARALSPTARIALLTAVILLGYAVIDLVTRASFEPVRWAFGTLVAVSIAWGVEQGRRMRRAPGLTRPDRTPPDQG